MGNMCISIMGTNGAGKSTLMRKFLPTDASSFIHEETKTKIYDCDTHYIIGAYDTNCGGLDSLDDFYDVIKLVDELVEKKHVLIEGVLYGTIYKTPSEIDDSLKLRGHSYYWTFIDITVEQCLESVVARRVSSGNFASLETWRVVNKYNSAKSAYNKAVKADRLAYHGSRDECEIAIRKLLTTSNDDHYRSGIEIPGGNIQKNSIPTIHITPEMRQKYFSTTDLSSFFG